MDNELIKVSYDSDRPTVLGRDLHTLLEVETPYHIWFPRMCEYGFVENVDFMGFVQNCSKPQGGRPTQEHQLTIDMAKELCMLQRNEKGKQARQYFINLEKAWNTPEMVMARALKMADKQIGKLETKIEVLNSENNLLSARTLKWANRNFINATVRQYAGYACEGNFGNAWIEFKKELLYKYGINLNSRITKYLNESGKKTKPKTLDMLDDSEVSNAVSTIVSMCRDRNIDISDLIKKSSEVA